jgi:hypothetical protein
MSSPDDVPLTRQAILTNARVAYNFMALYAGTVEDKTNTLAEAFKLEHATVDDLKAKTFKPEQLAVLQPEDLEQIACIARASGTKIRQILETDTPAQRESRSLELKEVVIPLAIKTKLESWVSNATHEELFQQAIKNLKVDGEHPACSR